MWSKTRKAAEKAIIEFVRQAGLSRHAHDDVAANAYEHALIILRRELNAVDRAKGSAAAPKTTMVVRAGGQTVVDPEMVNIKGDKYQVVVTENAIGELIIQSVDGRFWFQALDTNTIVLMIEPYPDRSAPSPEREPMSELRK